MLSLNAKAIVAIEVDLLTLSLAFSSANSLHLFKFSASFLHRSGHLGFPGLCNYTAIERVGVLQCPLMLINNTTNVLFEFRSFWMRELKK